MNFLDVLDWTEITGFMHILQTFAIFLAEILVGERA